MTNKLVENVVNGTYEEICKKIAEMRNTQYRVFVDSLEKASYKETRMVTITGSWYSAYEQVLYELVKDTPYEYLIEERNL